MKTRTTKDIHSLINMQRHKLQVSLEAADRMAKALDNPTALSDNLINAAKRYKERYPS